MGAADTAEDAGGSGTHRAQAPGPNVAPRVLASEIAAQEIALSVTPTALPWALVSLLADGGVGGGGIDGSSGMAGRGQGHLLPRSRDRYPTPVRKGCGRHDSEKKGRFSISLRESNLVSRAFLLVSVETRVNVGMR